MTDTYVIALPATELFVDHSYQPDLDLDRVHDIAQDWDIRRVGVIEVSDRGEKTGEDTGPRYAILDGQHRASAAWWRDDQAILVCNVHTGLTPAREAELAGVVAV